MKTRLVFIIPVIIFCISCDRKIKPFHFRYKVEHFEELNTYSGTFKRNYLSGSRIYHFKLSKEEQKQIDEFVKHFKINDIKSVAEKDTCDNGETVVSLPKIDHEFEFSFGEGKRRTFKWSNNDCEDLEIIKIEDFADSLKSFILRKTELQNIKETDVIIL